MRFTTLTIDDFDLSKDQKNIINDILDPDGDRIKKILGMTGTGKTRIVETLIVMLTNFDENALVVCKNSTIIKRMRDSTFKTGWGDTKEIRGKRDKRDKGISYDVEIDSDGNMYEIQSSVIVENYYNYIINALHRITHYNSPQIQEFKNGENNTEGYILPSEIINKMRKFNFIIIDEMQDFKYNQILNLTKMLTDNGKIIMLADKYQCIYKDVIYENEEGKINSLVPKTNLPGSWIRLKHIFRPHNKIQELGMMYAKKYLADKYGGETSLFANPQIDGEIDYYGDDDDNINTEPLTFEYLKNLNDKKISNKHIAILLETIDQVNSMACFLERNGIKTETTHKMNIDRISKKSFDLESENVKISTVHSFKGLEIDYVIYISENKNYKTKNRNELEYVAITRARKGICIIDNNYMNSCLKEIFKDYRRAILDIYKNPNVTIVYNDDDYDAYDDYELLGTSREDCDGIDPWAYNGMD